MNSAAQNLNHARDKTTSSQSSMGEYITSCPCMKIARDATLVLMVANSVMESSKPSILKETLEHLSICHQELAYVVKFQPGSPSLRISGNNHSNSYYLL
jgi:hypothetical protein